MRVVELALAAEASAGEGQAASQSTGGRCNIQPLGVGRRQIAAAVAAADHTSPDRPR